MIKLLQLLTLAAALLLPVMVCAQDQNAAELLGQSKSSGSMPIWSRPEADARQGLGRTARTSEPGVFLVGHPNAGTGTAWVVSVLYHRPSGVERDRRVPVRRAERPSSLRQPRTSRSGGGTVVEPNRTGRANGRVRRIVNHTHLRRNERTDCAKKN